ncbi:MAG: GAF domain-containing protein, partial [Anaerolineae bacterium]|nr:GAF domain-containing protein [Anaerolineae bacterium]
MSSLANPTSDRTEQTRVASRPAVQRVDLWLAISTVLGAATAVAMLAYLILAFNWFQLPFIGAMVTRNMVVDGALPFERVGWSALDAGVQRQDQIVAIDGQALPAGYDQASSEYRDILAGLEIGQTIDLEFDRPGDAPCPAGAGTIGECQVSIQLTEFGLVPFVGFFLAPYLTGIISLAVGIVVLWLRPHQTTAQLVSVMAFLLALLSGGLFDLNTTHQFIPLWLLATTMLGAVLVHIAMFFPARLLRLYRQPALVYVPYIFAGVLAALFLTSHFNPPSPQYQTVLPPFLVMVGGLLVLVIAMFYHRQHATSVMMRDQSNSVLIGLLLTATPITLWLVNVFAQLISERTLLPFNASAATPFAVIAPISFAYAVLQYRKFDTDRAISASITYSIMLIALVIGYFLLVFGATLVFQETIPSNSPLFVALTIFLIAIAFLPVRSILQRRIDRIYFRTRLNYQEYARQFTQNVSQADDIDSVIDALRSTLMETIAPSNVFVFLPGMGEGEFLEIGHDNNSTDITFSADTGVVNALEANDQMIYLEAGRPWPLEIRGEKARLEILHTLLILGLRGSKQFNGFISVGPPKSGRGAYTYEELHFIQSLVNQMAVATDRAQVIVSLERRVQELDALRQVSQAANFAIQFDELLELINTQTNRLIDAGYFYIILRDDKAGGIYYAFFQESWERFTDKENRRMELSKHHLINEILEKGQAIRVANYSTAMAERGAEITIETRNLKAWMGMPLVAGPRTVGAMVIASTKPNTVYSDDQYKFFGDISELAATSIDKARLFEETQKRARQLSVLNDISHQLAGELEDIDKLLDIITHSAVDILEVEAGSVLLVVDDNNDKKLEFKIAVGPAGQNLIGTRFPIDKGLAGKAATTGQPVLVNDASSHPDWGGEQTQNNGFQTHSILAVPLIANNQLMGVLEVINKRDGTNFVDDDTNLLLTFAGQAAVTINNAQLFQMTDQQLSARLAELETLEHIDGELNRALDARRVAEITINAALEQSGATAGLLGLVIGDPPVFQVLTQRGYTEQDYPAGAEGNIWPMDRGIVSRVLRTRQPDTQSDVLLDPNYVPSLNRSLSQMTIPMLSGGDVIAMLILETNQEPRLGLAQQFFVQRLAEHASVALANAQLYAELERSNNSKSEFVGFVAHELKNPMTSIKGYTDLMLMGSKMGKLDDQQEDWMNRIKLNIERMNTLV